MFFSKANRMHLKMQLQKYGYQNCVRKNVERALAVGIPRR